MQSDVHVFPPEAWIPSLFAVNLTNSSVRRGRHSTDWIEMVSRPPHLATLVTTGSPGRWFRDWPFRFGALWAEDYVEWVNPVSGRS
jgi:hypothetical protein